MITYSIVQYYSTVNKLYLCNTEKNSTSNIKLPVKDIMHLHLIHGQNSHGEEKLTEGSGGSRFVSDLEQIVRPGDLWVGTVYPLKWFQDLEPGNKNDQVSLREQNTNECAMLIKLSYTPWAWLSHLGPANLLRQESLRGSSGPGSDSPYGPLLS